MCQRRSRLTTKQLRHWNDSDIELAKAVADQTGIAIKQASCMKAETSSTRKRW
jgi:GAF domain-containing protein